MDIYWIMDCEVISLKVILLGESTVGKTSILLRGKNSTEDLPTLQQRTRIVGSYCKSMEVQGVPVELNMIDTVGAEKFRSLNPTLFPNTMAGVLVFDLSSPKTLTELRYWYSQFREYCPSIPIIVVGNKSDLRPHAVNKSDVDLTLDGMVIAEYMETSASENTNIPQLYEKIAKLAYDYSSSMDSLTQPKTHFKLDADKPKLKKKKKCC